VKNVTIYSTPTCHYCHMAMEFFDEKGVTYEKKNLAGPDAESQKNLQELFGLMGGPTGVPVIVVEGMPPILGFDKGAVSDALGL
jgi:glutaredoxin 3